MKKIGFIGASDKTNLIVYLAKILEIIGNRVIVVDTTATQKTRYIVPAINPTRAYLTDFENIDFAVGFESIDELSRYLGISEENLPYDYMLIDVDKYRIIDSFGLEESQNNYFVSGFDMYSLKRGISILKNLTSPMNLKKILCDYSIRQDDENYLEYLSVETKVTWNEFRVYMLTKGSDKQVIEENERVYRIRFKRLSAEYMDSLLYIAQDIVQDLNIGRIKKMIKE